MASIKAGAVGGALIGTAVPVVGNAVGAVVGGAVGAGAFFVATQIDPISNAITGAGEKAGELIHDIGSVAVQAIGEGGAQLSTAVSEIAQNVAAEIGQASDNVVEGAKAAWNEAKQLFSSIGFFDPIVLDLEGDGISILDTSVSQAVFDMDNDGYAEHTSWFSPGDGVLAVDKNGDGIINDITELFSEFFDATAGSGFEALGVYDVNQDGKIDAGDGGKFLEIRVWQDLDGDGRTDSGELWTLADLGITSLNLAVEEKFENNNGSVLLSEASFVRNGITRTYQEYGLLSSLYGFGFDENGDINDVEGLNTITFIDDGVDAVLDLASLDVAAVVGGDGNDHFFTTGDTEILADGGDGNDILEGGAGNDILRGGAGADILRGGAGNDILFIDGDDTVIDGGDGRDTAKVSGEVGLTLDLGAISIEEIHGSSAADTFTNSGLSGVHIDGGGGDDILTGGDGHDILEGGAGADQVSGGAGDDILYLDVDDIAAGIDGGDGRDIGIFTGNAVSLDLGATSLEIVDGTEENDSLYTSSTGLQGLIVGGGGGNDIISLGAGDDMIEGGAGDDVIDGGDGNDNAYFDGDYGDYQITEDSGTISVVDLQGDDGSDTLINVERLSFNDVVVHLDGSNNDPFLVGESFELRSGGYLRFSANELLSNDLDFDFDELKITGVGDLVGGSISYGSQGDLIFYADETFTGAAKFTYTVEDGHGGVATANVDINVKPSLPTDDWFPYQWYHEAINIYDVWDDYTGNGIVVGIYDEGVEYTHPDIAGNYDTSIDYDYVGNDSSPLPDPNDPDENHGTFLAGIIAGERNDEGVVGVAYGATLAGFRASWINGATHAEQQSELAAQAAVDISNNSWSDGEFYLNGDPAGQANAIVSGLQSGVTNGRGGLGTVYVASAGNTRPDGGNSNYYALNSSRFTVTVGAISTLDNYATFSSPGANLLVTAPGTDIISTDRLGDLGYDDTTGALGGDYRSGQGTSYSAPVVTGVVALMLEANANLGYRDIQEILANSATLVAAGNTETWDYNAATNWNGGGMHTSHDFGFGLVNAHAAVRLAETWQGQKTISNEQSVTISNSPSAAIADGATVTDTIAVANALDIQHVEVTLDISHTHMDDLTVTLTSPDGTESVLVYRPDKDALDEEGKGAATDNIQATFSTTHNWGESGIGDWTLTVTDASGGDTGTLNSWTLNIYGDTPSNDDVYIYTDEYALMTGEANADRRLVFDDSGSDILNASAVTSDIALNINPGEAGVLAGNVIEFDATTVIETVYTGDGDDTVIGNSADNFLHGGRGDDILVGGLGSDTLVGGEGQDTVSYSAATSGVNVNLNTGTATDGNGGVDTLIDIENASGSELNDTLAGNSQNNVIAGDGGDDSISGGDGDDRLLGDDGADTIHGDAGDDILVGGGGNDTLFGGAGSDVAEFRGYYADYTVTVEGSTVTVIGIDGTDTLTDIEFLRFADGDVYVGGSNADPTAVSESVATDEDTAITISIGSLLGNDTDSDGDPLVITGVGNPVNGWVRLTGTDIVFTPTDQFSGTASFDYIVSDGKAGTSTTTVTVNVNAVNDTPTGELSEVVVVEDGQAIGRLSASDIDSDVSALIFGLETQAQNGTVSIAADGSYTYTPTAGYNGSDSFAFNVTDASGAVGTQTVDVQIRTAPRFNQTFRINGTDGMSMGENDWTTAPAVATLEDGGFVVTWAAETATSTYYDVIAQRFDAGGNSIGAEFRVSEYTDSDQDMPAIAALKDGGFVISWGSWYQDGSKYGIFTRRYDAAGSAVTGDIQVNSFAENNQVRPSVTALAGGGYVVTWDSEDQDGSSFGVYGRVFDADGAQIGSEIQINTFTKSIQWYNGVSALNDGGFLVAWTSVDTEDYENSQDGHYQGVFAQRFNANGETVGDEFLVNTDTQYTQRFRDIISLDDGGFIIVWEDYDGTPSPGDPTDITGQRYDAAGETIGSEFRLNLSDYTGSQTWPAITTLSNGGFVAVWQSDDSNAIRGQIFDAASNAVGSVFDVETFSFAENWMPDVDALADGGFVVTWHASDLEGGNTQVYAKVFGGSANPLETVVNYTGGGGNDAIFGGAADDVLSGAGGNDHLSGGGGTDILDGGDGTDTAVFSGDFSEYAISVDDADFVIQHVSPAPGTNDDGITRLKNIEFAQFADQTLDLGDGFVPPEIENSIIATNMNSGAIGGQLFATDPDGSDAALTFALGQGPANGSVIVNSDGSYSFTPNASFAGEDAFTVQVTDEGGISSLATISIQVSQPHSFNVTQQANTANLGQVASTGLEYWRQQPSIAALVGGGFVVAYAKFSGGGDEFDILAQRYDASGNKLGGEFAVNTYTTSGQQNAQVATLSDGGFLISWSSEGQGGNSESIYMQRYDASGAAVGGETKISDFSWNQQRAPYVAELTNGGFAIAWETYGQDGDEMGVSVRVYNSDGSAAGASVQVNTFVQGWQSEPRIVAMTDGGFVVVWTSDADQDGDGSGIFGRRYDASGVAVGGEFQVNTFTDFSQLRPSVAALSGGGFIVVYQDGGNDPSPGSYYDIAGQIYDANANPVGSEFRINTLDISGRQRDPSVFSLNNGGFAVVWDSQTDVNSDQRWIRGQYFDANGSRVGHLFTLATYAQPDVNPDSTEDLRPEVVQLQNGALAVAWHALDAVAGDSKVYVQVVDESIDTLSLASSLEGGGGNDILIGADAGDTLSGLAGNDHLDGGGGDDILSGGSGNDMLFGGDGIDTAVFDGNAADYKVTHVNPTVVTVEHLTGADGIDTLTSVENIQFSDQTVAGANRAPETGDTPEIVFQDDIITFSVADLIANVTDFEGDDLSILGLTVSGGEGSLSDNGDGTWTFTAPANWDGVAYLTYTVNDGASNVSAMAKIVDHQIEPSASSTEFQINTATTGTQEQPSAAALTGGGFVVVWDSPDADGDGIFGQIFDASGLPLGAEFQINSYTTSDQYHPLVTGLADGGFVVGWESYGQDGEWDGVYAQRYDASGATIGSEFRINTATANYQDEMAVTSLNDGGFVAVWRSWNQDGNSYGVFAQRYDSAGATVGSEFQVNTTTHYSQDNPDVIGLSDGGFVVVWNKEGAGDDKGIFLQRYDAAGVRVGEETLVNDHIDGEQIHAQVDVMQDGGYVVIWTSDGQDGSGWGIFGQLFDASGNKQGSEFQVNSTTSGAQYRSDVVVMQDGTFVVTWESGDGSGYGVFAQRFDTDGTKLGDEFQVSTSTTNDQFDPAATVLSNGDILITYYNDGEISGQILKTLPNDAPDVTGPIIFDRISVDGSRLFTTAELLANTTDSEGDNLSIVNLTVSDGTLTDHGNGTWTYDPDANWNGVATFTFGISDGIETTETSATLLVNDTPQTSGPVTFTSIDEDSGRVITAAELLANASDVNGDTLTVVNLSASAGSLTDNGDGTWDYDPDPDWNGTVTFSYGISDGFETISSSATLTVSAVDDAPILSSAIADQTTDEDAVYSFDASVHFSNVDIGDTLTYTAELSGGGALPAWLSIDANTGVLSGTPLNGDEGAISVTVTATDGLGATVSDTFDLTVNEIDNTLTGTNGSDVLDGGVGDDTLIGGIGDDTLIGGDGDDTVVYAGHRGGYDIAYDAGNDSYTITDTDPTNGDDGTDTLSGVETVVFNDNQTRTNTILHSKAFDTWTQHPRSSVSADVALAPDNTMTADKLVEDTQTGGHYLARTSVLSNTAYTGSVFVKAAERTFARLQVGSLGAYGTAAFNLITGEIGTDNGNASNIQSEHVGNGWWRISLTATPDAGTQNGFAVYAVDEDDGDGSYTGDGSSGIYVWGAQLEEGTEVTGYLSTGTQTNTAYDIVDLTGNTVNDAPEVSLAIEDQTADENTAYSYDLSLHFTDPDIGEALTYTAELAGGGALPAWLSIDANTGVLSGTPLNGDEGAISVTVTATDSRGETAADTFELAINNTNDAPLAADDGGGNNITTPVPVGSEFQISSHTSSDQWFPAVTALAGGGFVVTWQSFGQDGDDDGVYGQLYDVTGAPVGAEFQVNSYSTSYQRFPSIASLSSGGFVVTWESENQDGSGYGVYGRLYNASGAAVGNEFRINSYVDSNQQAPSVASLADGDFIVTWSSSGQDGDGWGIYGQRYAANGATVGGEFHVSSYTSLAQYDSAVTGLADGGFVVTWESEAQDGSGYGIFGQRYAADGTAVGGEFQINSVTYTNQQRPFVTALLGGGFVVTWQSHSQDGSSEGVYGQLYAVDGTTVGGEFQVNSYTFSGQRHATITAISDGGFVVTWHSYEQDGDNYGIYGQRYAADGATVGSEFQINSYAVSSQRSPIVTALSDGRLIVAWASDGQDGNGYGIFGQMLDVGPVAIVTDEDVSITIAVADLLANDIDVDIDALSITAVSNAVNGTVSLDGNGDVLFTPNADFSGDATFDYTVSDGKGGTDTATVTVAVDSVNDAPTLSSVIADQSTDEDVVYSFDASTHFADADIGDTLTYTAELSGGGALPAWLSIDANTGVLSGTPSNGDVDTLSVTVIATDGDGLTASDNFDLVVDNTNDAPTLSSAIAEQSTDEDAVYSFDAAAHFADVDVGDTLTYTAELLGGGALPAWLSIDADTGVLSGAPDDADVGTIAVTVTVTDGAGLAVGDTFDLTVNSVNDAPVATSDSAQDEITTPIAVGSEFQINSFTIDSQYAPSTAALAGGGFVVTWTSRFQDGSPYSVFGQRFDANGAPVGGEFQINTYTASVQAGSDVTALSSGGFVATWSSYGQDGSGYGVYGQRYDANGQPAGGEFQINTYTDSTQGGSSIAALSSDDFVVVWNSDGQDGDGAGIYGQRYDVSGLPIGAEFQVNSTTTNDQQLPGVAALSGGGFVVTWDSFLQDGDSYGIYGQRYDSNGVEVGGEFQINTYTTAGQSGSELVALADGGFLVTWTSIGQDGSGSGVFGQRYDANGVAVGGEFQVNSYTTGVQELSTTAALSDGGFVVFWDSADDSGYGVFGRRYDSSGLPTGVEFRANSSTLYNQYQSSVSALPNGQFIVAWTADAQDGNEKGVFGQILVVSKVLSTGEDTPVTIAAAGLLSNDTDEEGDTLTLTAVSNAVNGTVVLDGDGDVLFTPDADFSGDATFDYTVSDGNGGTDTATVTVTVEAVDDAPALSSPIADQSAEEDAVYSFDASAHFADADVGDTLTYTAELSGGGALPAWLSIDAYAGLLMGIPTDGDRGVISVIVTATDSAGLTVSDSFDLTVAPPNHAPTVVSYLPDQSTDEDAVYSFDASAHFADADVGDTLTYSALAWSTSPLPAWLSIDANTGVLSGTPENGDVVNNLLVTVTVSDGAGSTASDDFLLNVNNTNDAPTIISPIPDVVLDEEEYRAWDLTEFLADLDRFDTATYSAELVGGGALPNWLSIDATWGGITAYPNNGDSGTISVIVTATDAAGLATSDTFDITVNDSIAQPMLLSPIADHSTDEDAVYSFDASAHFTGAQNYTARYAGGGRLPAWLTMDYDTGILSGTPDNSDAGTLSVKVTAIDYAGTEVTDTFDLSVNNVNDAPVAVDGGGNDITTPLAVGRDNDFVVNSYTMDYQSSASTAALAGGGFVVAWGSIGQDGDSGGVYGQRYDSSGVAVGSEFLINSTVVGSQGEASVAGLSGGGFVVTWSSGGQDSDGSGIYGQRYDASGVSVGSEFQINTHVSANQHLSSVIGLAGGGFAVAWQSDGQDGDSGGVFSQLYNASGAAIGNEFQINVYTTSSQQVPTLTALSNGGFVATWQSDGQDGDGTGIYGRRYDASGTALGGEFQVNSAASGSQTDPSVAALSDGGFVVTWAQQGGSGTGVYGQRFAADGTAAGSEFQVSSTLLPFAYPTVTGLPDGGFVIAWGRYNFQTNTAYLYGQRYDADSTAVGNEFTINSPNIGFHWHPSITALSDGRFMVTWDNQDDSDIGVRARVYDAGTSFDSLVTDKGVSLTIAAANLVANDIDIDGDMLSISGVSNAVNGTVSLDGNGDVLFTPDSGFHGQAFFDYTISDGNGGTDTATVTVDVYAPGIDNLIAGTSNADTLDGTADNDHLIGYGGDDTLNGGEGNDTLEGGAGADVLDGGGQNLVTYSQSFDLWFSSDSTVTADAGLAPDGTLTADRITEGTATTEHNVGRAVSLIAGHAYTISAYFKADTHSYVLLGLSSGSNYPQVKIDLVSRTAVEGYDPSSIMDAATVKFEEVGDGWARVSAVVVPGTTGTYNLRIGHIMSSGGSAHYQGDGAGSSYIWGAQVEEAESAGNYVLTTDVAIGADFETDTVSYALSSLGVTVDLSTNTASGGDAEGDTIANFENVTGSAYADTLIGDTGTNVLTGGDGNDALVGGDGEDTLDGGDGYDNLAGGAGADTLIGGAGKDWVDYTAASGGVMVNLATGMGTGGDAEGDTYSGIEQVNGTAYADVLTGDTGENWLFGNGGNDQLNGGGANDLLNGGDGDDTLDGGDGYDNLVGGAGADTLIGGTGDDWADYSAASGGVTVNLATGTGTGSDAEGDIYSGIEAVNGSAYADALTGDTGENWLFAQAGDDSLLGGNGNDRLNGGAGNDALTGGAGNDIYEFGRGDGADVVNNIGEGASSDTVEFGSDISIYQLWFEQSGDDLVASIVGSTTDQITIDDWYLNSGANEVSAFETSGGDVLLSSQVQSLVSAMAGFTKPDGTVSDLDEEPSYASLATTISQTWDTA